VEENMTKCCQLDLQEHENHLQEFEASLISRREYHQILKKPVKAHVVDPLSSDWDLEQMDADFEGNSNNRSGGEWNDE
jgi:hypothetical protein